MCLFLGQFFTANCEVQSWDSVRNFNDVVRKYEVNNHFYFCKYESKLHKTDKLNFKTHWQNTLCQFLDIIWNIHQNIFPYHIVIVNNSPVQKNRITRLKYIHVKNISVYMDYSCLAEQIWRHCIHTSIRLNWD